MKNPILTDGVYAAVLTPMRADFSIDHKKLVEHSFSLLEAGCTGVALFGTTGEGPSFSLAEKIDLLQKILAEGLDPGKIIVASGSSNLADTARLGEEVVRHGCAAYLIVPPSFYKNIRDEGVLAFYRETIQRIASPKLQILLYHIPQYSGVPISLEVIKTLHKEFPNTVIGIKESEGNLPFTKMILQEVPGFKVFVGNEGHILEAVHLGGAGAICGLANLYPKLICSFYSQAKTGQHPYPLAIDTIFKAIKGVPFIPAAKAVMEEREGEIWRSLRPPLAPLSQTEKRQVIRILQETVLR